MRRKPYTAPRSATRCGRPGLHRASSRSRRTKGRPLARQARRAFISDTTQGAGTPKGDQLRRLAKAVRRPGFARSVARTAGYNIAATFAAGLGGVIIARTVGPTIRGEYAAVTAWFGVALLVGGMGQPAALCFFVARDPLRAREYVATSRAIMLVAGTVALVAGMALAPLLARGNAEVALGYRIAFGTSIIALVGSSYTYALQARDISRWNVSRTIQPLLSLIVISVLWRLGFLTLDAALLVLAATMLGQLGWSYWACRRPGLAPGRASAGLVRPLAAYGAAQIAALTPSALNEQLDQLVLSQTVPPADLGRYAIAVSLTLLPLTAVSAIGYVAFPRLASERGVTAATHRLQRLSILGSAGLTVAMLVPLAIAAPWLVPLVYGPAYRGAVPLIWILAPGAVFLNCGQIIGNLLRGRSHPAVVAWAQGFAAIFTIALLVTLLPFLGVYAAAIASTISYGITTAVMLYRLLH
ncbi:MAG: oligosaccharide flippase family protein, partial [Candidatus Acidiferrales bacterium]